MAEPKRNPVRLGACYVEFGFANSQSVEAFEEAVEIVRAVRNGLGKESSARNNLNDALKLLEQAWDGIVAGTAESEEE